MVYLILCLTIEFQFLCYKSLFSRSTVILSSDSATRSRLRALESSEANRNIDQQYYANCENLDTGTHFLNLSRREAAPHALRRQVDQRIRA